MQVEIDVHGRSLSVQNAPRIPSGGLNDVEVVFNFKEDCLGWKGLNLTAVFNRPGQAAYKVNVRPGKPFKIPANVIHRQGNLYIGLVGTGSNNKVVQSNTVILLIEPNALNIASATIYPQTELGTYDTDAYAQYVEAVNEAANRAEAAAAKLETVTIVGGYTKDEADARFAKKASLPITVNCGYLDFKCIELESVPTIDFEALPNNHLDGYLGYPASMNVINRVIVNYTGKNPGEVKEDFAYSGFELRRLNDKCADKLIIGRKGVVKIEEVCCLRLSEIGYRRVDDNIIMVDLTGQPPINLAFKNDIATNVGSIIYYADANGIQLIVPEATPTNYINQVELWYPRQEKVKVDINLVNGLGKISNQKGGLTVVGFVNDRPTPLRLFNVVVDLDLAAYVQSYKQDIHEVNLKAEKAVNKATMAELKAGEAIGKVNGIRIYSDETRGLVNSAISTANEALTTATSAKDTALGISDTANNALSAATEARTYATSANAAALEAKSYSSDSRSLANEAKAYSLDAKSIANEAKAFGVDAKSIATEAKAYANDAKFIANTAQATADAAKVIARTAEGTANSANATAIDAKEKVDSIVSEGKVNSFVFTTAINDWQESDDLTRYRCIIEKGESVPEDLQVTDVYYLGKDGNVKSFIDFTELGETGNKISVSIGAQIFEEELPNISDSIYILTFAL